MDSRNNSSSQASTFTDSLISRYFEASAAELIRDEFSNKPRSSSQLGLGIDTVGFHWNVQSNSIWFQTNANPMSLFRLVNMQARRNQQEIRNAFMEGG